MCGARGTYCLRNVRRYAFITILNCIFGGLCYMLYGAATKANVVSNLTGNGVIDAVKARVAAAFARARPRAIS